MEAKAQILIVDDDVGLASNLKDILEGQGYNVAVAHDGQAALGLCRESVFDLVLVDIKLPDMPGLEVIDKLTDLLPPTEYIIITGHGSLETAVEGVKRSKVLAYETKPLDMDRLLLLTRQVMERKQAEQARDSERDRLQALMDGLDYTGIGIDVVGLDYRVVLQNDILQRRFGDLAGELCYQGYMGLEEPCDFCPMTKAVEGNKVQRVELKAADGKDYQLLSAPFPNADGSVDKAIEVVLDITERKQMEEALRESEEKYRLITDNMVDTVWLMDLNMRTTFISPSVVRTRGFTLEELQDMPLEQHLTPGSLEVALGEIAEHLAPEKPEQKDCTFTRTLDLEFFRKNGSRFWSEVTMTLIRDDEGCATGLLGVGRDVTDRKQTEEALRQSEERYRTILDEMDEGYYETDLAGTFTFFNDSMCRMLGYSRKELMGMNYRDYTPEEDVKAMFAKYNGVYRTGKPVKGLPYKTIRKDGSTVHAEVSVLPLRNEQGETVGFRGIRRDVTERRRMEEDLRQSEERYRTILDEMDEGYYELDLNGNLTFCNDSYRQALGYSAEEITGMNYADFTAEPDRDRMFQMFTDIYRKGKLMESFTCQALRKDGGTLTVESAASPLRDKEGQIVGFRGIGRDITERNRIEEALRESEERYRTILEDMEDSYFEVDLSGHYTFFNDSLCRTFRCSREELLGASYRAYMTQKVAKVVLKAFNKVYRTGKPNKGFTYELVRKDGSTAFDELSAFPLRNQGGKIIGFRRIGHDVTERKQAEEVLRQSEERYRTILDDMEGGYFEVDIAGNFTFVNDALCRHLGYSREEMIGMNNRAYMDEENAEQVHKTFNEVYRSGKPAKWFSWELIRKSGEGRFVEASVYPLSNEAGENIGFRGIANDITERKRMGEERREMEQKAHLASRLASVGEMASGIAHEINNPLTAVIGYSQLLMAKDLPEDIRGDIGAIHDGSQRVAGVVKRLLAFARQQRLEREYVNINEIIETTLALRTYEMETGNVEVKVYLDPMLPATIADGAQLQQVFLNLIINAETEMRLAHGKGNLLVKTEAIDDTIRISFEDDGPGIASENLGRLFEPFFTTREVGEGTGLGLSVCHGIVSEHGGTIHVESQLRKGATFIVELPIVTESEQLKLAEPEAEEPRRVAGAKILAVDDEPLILQLVRQVLTREGYEVETVDNATEALERIKSQRYSLILLDIKMPGMSGTELYRRIQRMARPMARRVLFITGDVIGADTVAFLARTKAPHITKPFDGAQLKRKVNRMLAENP